MGGKRCCKNVRVKEVQITTWKYPVCSLGTKGNFCCLCLPRFLSSEMCSTQFGMHMEVLSWTFPSQTASRGFSATQDTSLTSARQGTAPGLVAFHISTVTGTPRINFYILIVGSLETALGLWRETGLPKNYLEPESHCFWVGTGQLTALQELLNAFESCFCPSFHQTTVRFKDRCLRGHFEGK